MVAVILATVIPWLYHPALTQIVALAAAATDDPVFWLANLGTAGVWVVCTMTGLQPTRAEVRRLDAEIARLVAAEQRRDEKDRSKDQAVEALVSLMTSRTLPTLGTAAAEVSHVAQQAAAQPDAALGERLENALRRVERVLGDERST